MRCGDPPPPPLTVAGACTCIALSTLAGQSVFDDFHATVQQPCCWGLSFCRGSRRFWGGGDENPSPEACSSATSSPTASPVVSAPICTLGTDHCACGSTHRHAVQRRGCVHPGRTILPTLIPQHTYPRTLVQRLAPWASHTRERLIGVTPVQSVLRSPEYVVYF